MNAKRTGLTGFSNVCIQEILAKKNSYIDALERKVEAENHRVPFQRPD